MSIKNLYLPAQSGKIRMENGVYCGLKGVKSMIEVIYKEETDTTKETAEYVKLPNNVRQIGEIKGKKKTIYGRLCLHLFEKDRKKSSRRRGGGDFVWFLSLDRAGRLYFYPERPADPGSGAFAGTYPF